MNDQTRQVFDHSADIAVGVLLVWWLNGNWLGWTGSDLPAMWAIGIGASAAVAVNMYRAGVRINWSPLFAAGTSLLGLLTPWAKELFSFFQGFWS